MLSQLTFFFILLSYQSYKNQFCLLNWSPQLTIISQVIGHILVYSLLLSDLLKLLYPLNLGSFSVYFSTCILYLFFLLIGHPMSKNLNHSSRLFLRGPYLFQSIFCRKKYNMIKNNKTFFSVIGKPYYR